MSVRGVQNVVLGHFKYCTLRYGLAKFITAPHHTAPQFCGTCMVQCNIQSMVWSVLRWYIFKNVMANFYFTINHDNSKFFFLKNNNDNMIVSYFILFF